MASAKDGASGKHSSHYRQCAQWLAYYLGVDTFGEGPARSPVSNAHLAAIVEAGLPVAAAELLRLRTCMSAQQFGQFIPRSTLESKRERGEQTLSAEQSDRIMRVAVIYARASDVFADQERAAKWMKRTNPQMPDERAPEDMLKTSYGAQHVDDVLTRLEHGIPA